MRDAIEPQTTPKWVTGFIWRALYLGVVTGIIFLLFNHWAYDDPFISYRYARNLAAGEGFVYNPGERILSTTSALFVIFLAFFSELWPDIPHFARLAGSFGLALGALFLWELARVWKTPLVGWAALILYPSHPLLLPTLGSEEPLYLAFCLGAFLFYAREQSRSIAGTFFPYGLAALCAALAALARPDGLLVAAILAVHYLFWVKKPLPWKAIALFGALTLPWVIFAWWYFGSPVPVTLAAKQFQGTMLISERFAHGFLTILSPYVRQGYFWLEVALAVGGVYLALRGSRSGVVYRPWLLFLTWPTLYFIAYVLLGVSRYFWYYAPLVPGGLAAVGLGLTGLVNLRPRAAGSVAVKQSVWPLAIQYSVLALLAIGQMQDVWKLSQSVDPRATAYGMVGEWLRDHTPVDAHVAALEVGMIGYDAERPMLDFAGLLQPGVAPHLAGQASYEGAAQWAVETYQPAYVVLCQNQFPNLEQGWIADHCQVARGFSPDELGSYPCTLTVYVCSY